ncbi:MAG: ABA4-like family protein [Pseudomonadota bacterium]
MTPESVFSIIGMVVLPAWLVLMIVPLILPRWGGSQALAFGIVVPLMSFVYAAILIKLFAEGNGFDTDSFSSLESVMALLSDPWAALLGWSHYLAFDLFVGAWMVRDARVSRVPHILIIIPLFLTFMAGPFGLVLYLILRQLRRKSLVPMPHPFAERTLV